MRYEDASHTGAFQGQGPIANDDADQVAAGAKSSATGNLISGEGTQTGAVGADSATDGHITAIAGKGGEDSSFSGGKLSVLGEYGKLSVDAQGNYVYEANKGVENVRDRFTYTLADNNGASDTASLIIEIGKTPFAIKADAQQIVPGPDGVVTLPPGVELSDVHVVGRNLVIDMPDGTQLIIIDGAVFVPQLVLGGVEVPATNVAALLIGQEIAPAAGENVPSSGGNFAVPPPPLDPGVPLGDLIPPTELDYIPPEPEETFPIGDDEPEAGAAFAQLDDDAQDDGNPGGPGDDPGTDIAEGFLPGSDGDGDLTFDLLPSGDLPDGFTFADQGNGDVWIMQGANHVLTISVDPATGAYTVTQVAAIDHPAGNTENNLDFTIDYTVTDEDGDFDTGTLTVNVDDDTPIAVVEGQVLGLVDEDDLPSGNNDNADGDDDPGNADGDNDGTTTAGAAGSLSGLFSFGADQPGSSGLGTNTAGMTAQGLTSNGVALAYDVEGDTLTATAGGETIFTLTVHADGSWEFDLEGQLDHDVADTEDDLDIDFSSMIIGTDHDGDTVSLPDDTFVITVDDDLPVPAGERQSVTGLVDEDDLPDGNHDDADGDDDPGDADGDGDGTTTGGDEGSLSSLFSFGADQPGTVELSSDTSGLPALTSNNVPVTYSVQGNVLTASAGAGNVVFTLTVNEDGSWVFDLQGQLDHPEAGTEDNLDLDFSSVIIGVDADGDTAGLPPESFVVTVDDDMPQEFEDCPDDVITVNEPGTIVEGNLNLPPVGADDPGVVSFGVEDGDPVLDTGDNPVTANGQALFYFINDDGVLEARVGDETGDVIFTVTLNDDGTYTYEQVGSLGEGGTIDFEDLTSASAGNVEFRGVGADDAETTVDLLLSAGPADGQTVNTDSDSIGSANQSMDDGETVRIDLVSDLTTGEATPSGFGYSGHVSSNSYIQLIPQVQGSQSETVAFTVWALDTSDTQADESDRDPTGGFDNSSITSITEVTVKDYLTGESTTVAVAFTDGTTFVNVNYGVSVRVNADGSVTFSGIQQGDSYGINTGAGEFNAIVVQAEPAGTGGSSEDSFDLGIFSIGVANEFEPVDLSIPIILTDSDGDPVVCDLDIHIGPPLEAEDIVVTVNEAGLPLIGSDSASDSETQGGDLQGQVSGGSGPYTFAFAPGESGDGTYGTLTLNEDGTFSYTLETPFDSQPDADDGTNPELGAETFEVVATDQEGATQTLTIKVNIIDDVPTAVDDTDDIDAGEYGPATGNVITDNSVGDQGDSDDGADTKGADGASVVGVAAGDTGVDLDNPATVGVVIQGTYGKLTLNSDGSYSYTRDPGTDGGVEDVFTYTLEDGDGDRSNATLTITIDDSPVTIDGPDEGEAGTIVDEKGLPVRTGEPEGSGEHAAAGANGDTSETTNGTINFSAPDGPAIIRIDGVVVTGAIGQQFVGDHGTLTITSYNAGTGQIGYSYTLADNTSGEGTFDDFALQVEDQDGDIANDTLVIDIIDDEPAANDDTDTVDNNTDQAVGNVITGSGTEEGTGNADYPGADDFDSISGLVSDETADSDTNPTGGFDVTGLYGSLHMNADGSYTYTRDPGSPGAVSESFTYTYLDNDGDEATAVLTINIDDSTPSLPDPPDANLDDDVVPGFNGNDPAGTGDDDPDGIGNNVVNGQLVGSGGDGDLDYFFSATQNGLPTGFSVGVGSDVNTLIIVQDQGGSDVTVLTIELDNTDGSYSVTQNAPIRHPDGLNENNIPDINVRFYAEDVDGSQSPPATLTINVDDDTPVVNVTEGDETTVTLTTDDAETIGGASDTAQSTANFSSVFGLTQSAGADGTAAAATLSYVLDVNGYSGGPGGVNSGLESHNNDIFLYEIGGKVVGSTSATLAGVDGTNTVFDVGVTSPGGVVTLTQYQQIDHDTVDPSPTGGPDYADHIVSLADDLVTLTASASLTDRDGDTATDSEVANIGANLRFTDDGPDAALSGQAVGTVTLDETRDEGTDTAGGTAPNGDQSATINFALNFVNGGAVDYGADGAGSTVYALSLTGADVPSGLYALDNTDTAVDGDGYGQGGQIVLNQAGNVITGSFNGTNYFTITIDPATGIVTFAQINNIWHPTPGSSAAALDELATLNTTAPDLIKVVQTVTDFDGDTDTAQINIGQGVFRIQDDGPRFGPDIDETLNIENTGTTPSGTGDLDIVIGTDSPNGGVAGPPAQNPNDISLANFTIQINGVDADNVVLTEGTEDATEANYSFTFDYDTGDGGTANGTGTLVFDKGAGTYTVEITSGPIEGFSVQSVQGGEDPVFLDYPLPPAGPGGDVDNGIAVVDLGSGDFFIQFTGQSNVTTPASAFGNDDLWGGGSQSEVKISSTAIGVFGNSVQSPDVLDYNFYSSDPGATLGAPTASAGTTFIKIAQFNGSEDFVVTLKLADPNNPGTGIIERTFVVNGNDVLTTAPAGYPALGTNEGYIIFEPNDYQTLANVPDNYEIVGMQLRSSTEGVQSSAGEVYNFNGALNAADVSTTSFSPAGGGDTGTNDNDVFKIIDIGVIRTSTEDQSATIEFDVNIHDADGDTATQHITVNVGDPVETLAATQFSEMSAKSFGGEESFSSLAYSSNDNSKFAGHVNGFGNIGNTGIVAGMVAASGMTTMVSNPMPTLGELQTDMVTRDSFQSLSTSLGGRDGLVDSHMGIQSFGHETMTFADAAPLQGSGHGFTSLSSGSHVLDSYMASSAPSYVPQLAADQGPAINFAAHAPVAPTVAMVSAEALQAAGLTGDAHIGGAVNQVIAEALAHGNGSTQIDAVLDAIHGGNLGDAALANLASPAGAGVPAWDMAMQGGSATSFDMMMKMGAEMLHHDAVQPTHNG
jgi:T1SS-143 domain-containing protein